MINIKFAFYILGSYFYIKQLKQDSYEWGIVNHSAINVSEKLYDLYKTICESIDSAISGEIVNYKVHQLLMGSGKSEIITPLIVFKYMYNNNINKDIENILIVLPEHLVKQSFNTFMKQYYWECHPIMPH